MIKKNYSKKGTSCRTTFRYYPEEEEGTNTVSLLGEFSEWQPIEMSQRKDGSFSTTISLESGKSYQFRYLIDENKWLNEKEADSYVYSPFGSQNAVIEL